MTICKCIMLSSYKLYVTSINQDDNTAQNILSTGAGSNHLDAKCDISKSYICIIIKDFITAEATANEVKGKVQYC